MKNPSAPEATGQDKPSALARFRQEATAQGIVDNDMVLRYGELLVRYGPERFFEDFGPGSLFRFIRERFDFVNGARLQPFSLQLTQLEPAKGDSFEASAVFGITVADRPFLIDSLQAYFQAYNIPVWAIIHPVLSIKRDKSGRIAAADGHDGDHGNEAHITIISAPLPDSQRQPVLESVRLILQDVCFAVDDFGAVVGALEEIRGLARQDNAADFIPRILDWFESSHFVFTGLIPFEEDSAGELRPQYAEGLGVFNPKLERATHHEALHAQGIRLLREAAGAAPFLLVEETNVHSLVHRRNRLSAILVSPQAAGGKRRAAVVLGIFTNRSLREDVLTIPVVADSIREVLAAERVAPGSHKYKEVVDFFNGMPRYELFRLSRDALQDIVRFLWGIVDQPRVDVVLLEEPAENLLRIMIGTPGAELVPQKQRQIRETVESMYSRTAQIMFSVMLGNSAVLTIVFQGYANWKDSVDDPDTVCTAIRESLRTKDDRLLRQWLRHQQGAVEERRARLLMQALPEDYKVGHADWEVMTDLDHLERMAREQAPQFQLRPASNGDGFYVVLYVHERVSLSRIMPLLSNLRLHVVEEKSYAVDLPERPVHMHTFLVQPPEAFPLEPERHQPLLRDLIYTVLLQDLDHDPLIALLVTCGFSWRQVNLLCLYRNYLMQIGTVYTRNTINETLIHRHRVTAALFGLFDARFNPEQPDLAAAAEQAESLLDDEEREVDNLTEDRILKAIRNLVHATMRTNFYADSQDPVIAVKLRSGDIEALPRPRPLFEIYVYGPVMEGVHLRGDRIARGGIRYSDRPDDFRTEVLGLMATQMKKNALIVPLGSKGGFVVTNLRPYGGDVRAAGDGQYPLYIRALLSVTDNLVQGVVQPPARVVRYDEDDPYLVVAADKGTAHLSDTANATAHAVGFWLDDAFASGGSHGYDHKKVGITARGAWESVKRHFWELGIDTQSQPVRVVGIGDMSGDVFGNGMLLSRHLKVVGAFDHRNIFIDPDPDPAVSFAERERMFALPRSSWMDYDKGKLSAGGGIYPRNAKEIKLSEQARAMLGVDDATLSGEELIQALLGLDVDLLWNGGIGTYIKSASETNADVGDPNNNAVRINAADCRARVIGEGGNLGLTQQARIELDLRGCILISDAVDNAGGVNMSDQEVNLKILLGRLMEAGTLKDYDARNALLAALEPAVTEVVLRANFRQVLVISMDRRRSKVNVNTFIRLVDQLAIQGGMDRRTEAIPGAQRFQQFQTDGVGIPRPVLSVLLSYAKMLLYRRLVDDDVMDEPLFSPLFGEYFARELREQYNLDSLEHPLRRNIIATMVTNRVIDQAGMTFVSETSSLTGASWPEVVKAYLIADMALEGPKFREAIYAQASVMPAEEQYDLLIQLEWALGEMARWLLLVGAGQEGAGSLSVGALHDALKTYIQALPQLLSEEERQAVTETADRLGQWQLADDARALAGVLPQLGGFLSIHRLTQGDGLPLGEAHQLVHEVNQRLGLTRLSGALGAAQFSDQWQKQLGDRQRCIVDLAREAKLDDVLHHRSGGTPPAAWVDAYLETRAAAWKRYQDTLQSMFSAEGVSLVAMAVAVGQLETL